MDTETYHQALSDTVRFLMARRGESVSGLAAELDQHQPNLSGKLNGKRSWRFDDLFVLAAHYDMTPADLVAAMEATKQGTAHLNQGQEAETS